MELVDGTPLDRLLRRGAAAGRDRARLRGADRHRACRRARERHHPSRHQARQHRDHARRAREGARLRSRKADRARRRPKRRSPASRPSRALIMGTAAYMSPEQARRPSGRRAVRHVLVRRGPLRDARGTPAVRWLDASRRDHVDPPRSAAAVADGTRRMRRPKSTRSFSARWRRIPAARYPGCGGDARATRRGARETHAAARERLARAERCSIPPPLLLIAAIAFGAWQMVQARPCAVGATGRDPGNRTTGR